MTPSPADLERARRVVGERAGLAIEDGRLGDLADALGARTRATRCGDVGAYLGRAEGDDGELRALAAAVTVGETYFFRNPAQLEACADLVLSRACDLRLLSAGCASGEEAYTLAILARERAPGPGAPSILGVDVNASLLARARTARYSAWSLRQTPPDVRERYFTRSGAAFELDPAVREGVSFEERNLLADDDALWRPASYDAIFFRNVAIYLRPEATRAVVERCARALKPGGYLFLGEAETLRGVSLDFHLCQSHGAFYYQRRGALASPASTTPAAAVAPAAGPQVAPGDTSWLAAIGESARRLEALAARRASPAESAGGAAPRDGPSAPSRAAIATELVARDRFADALDSLRHLPQDDPDTLLLTAVALTNRGLVAEAEAACERLLAVDDLHAGAHYLRALCREHAGDAVAAAALDQAAAHLDRTFAMPEVHLGLLARRAGDREAARRAFARALELLPREEPARILVFGGGFTRDALVRLCRAELAAIGGGP